MYRWNFYIPRATPIELLFVASSEIRFQSAGSENPRRIWWLIRGFRPDFIHVDEYLLRISFLMDFDSSRCRYVTASKSPIFFKRHLLSRIISYFMFAWFDITKVDKNLIEFVTRRVLLKKLCSRRLITYRRSKWDLFIPWICDSRKRN